MSDSDAPLHPLRRAPTIVAVLLAAAATASGCSSSTPSSGSAASGTGAAAQATPSAAADADAKVNIEEIFPAGRGRELVLNNCTSCHTIVPIVVLQMTKEAWERNSRDHRGRVSGLSDEDFKVLYDYVEANFNPDRPVPKLPKSLLDTWTSY
jgi:cytochrome c5